MISTTMKKTMSLSSRRPWLVLLVCTISLHHLSFSSSSSPDTESPVFVFCTQSRYLPGTSSYQNTVISLLSSIVNSATVATFNNFTQLPDPTASNGTTLYGLFQCRGDVTNGACSGCISRAATQLDALCVGSCGGMIQFDDCFIKYDNSMFVGVEDKAVVFKRCGPQLGIADSGALGRRDAALSYMETWTQTSSDHGAYRVGSSGEMKAVAQCIEDLTVTDCQDCLMEAIGRLKHECGAAAGGDLFLGSCYARYSNGADQLSNGRGNNNENEFDKTLAILLGLAAVVTFVIVLISYLTKLYSDHAKGAK